MSADDVADFERRFALDEEAVEAIRKERLHQKVATAVFFESNGGTTRSEATLPEIRLAVGHPGMDLGKKVTTPATGPQPSQPTPTTPPSTPTAPTPPIQPTSPAAGIRRLTWAGEVPPQKWMNFYTKVLSRFVTGTGLKLTVNVEVTPQDGISKQKVDETKNALRELGLDESVKDE